MSFLSILPFKSQYVFCFSFLLITTFCFSQNRVLSTLSEGWKFQKGAINQPIALDYDDANWENVSIPHDWAIKGPFILDGNGSTGKLPWKGQGWYRKKLDIPTAYAGKRLYLLFDGVMAFPKIYLNGEMVGEWDYGYNSFYVDITDYAKVGAENILAVYADTREFDSRWYPGAGIYRKVQLLAVNPVHVDIWGTYVNTPIIKPHYTDVRINTTINNFSAAKDSISIVHTIVDMEGNSLAKGQVQKWVRAGKTADLETTILLMNPIRWDIDNPYLYKIKTAIYQGKELVDNYTTKFGVRTIRFDPDYGFFLNERRVQLKGVNNHHDHGPLGAAFYPRAMERQLEIMKSMGVNAFRNSHNTAAPELLSMCDSMGILFFNEVFDKYDAKAGITEDTDFDEFAHRNIRNFIKRDRNHPSVFIWSIGNEEPDAQTNYNNGFQRLHTMVNYARKYDAFRPITLVNDKVDAAALRHFDYYDVLCWNYGRRYRLARQMEPNKAVIISESASTLSTRGFYEFPLPKEKTDFTKSLQVSSYDYHAPWWAEIADDDFMWQQDESYIAGEFVWTGFDYLGEPVPYDNKTVKEMGYSEEKASRSSYFGIVDLVGIPKDRYYLYKSYWKPDEDLIHILPHWNWKDRVGKNVPVFVYTNGDRAELFINGKSQGMQHKQPMSQNSAERFRLMWMDVTYEPGEVKVVAYKGARKIGEQTIQTTGEVSQLRLTPDRNEINADGQDLSYILIEGLDADGNVNPLAMNEIHLIVEGNGSIIGLGNGDPQSFEPFQSDKVKLFYGKAMLIVKSDKNAGTISITAESKKLTPASTTVTVK